MSYSGPRKSFSITLGPIDSKPQIFAELNTPIMIFCCERRGEESGREALPLLDSPLMGRAVREGHSPSLTYTPPSLSKGRGQGDRFLNSKEMIDYRQISLCSL